MHHEKTNLNKYSDSTFNFIFVCRTTIHLVIEVFMVLQWRSTTSQVYTRAISSKWWVILLERNQECGYSVFHLRRASESEVPCKIRYNVNLSLIHLFHAVEVLSMELFNNFCRKSRKSYCNSRGFISRLIFCHCNIILKSQCVTTWYFLVDFQTGDICIDCLEKWEPSMKISDLLVAFQYMLSEPSLSKPINTEAAVMLIQSPEKYHQLVPEKINLLNVEGKLLTISCNKFWQRKRKLKINQRLAKSKS